MIRIVAFRRGKPVKDFSIKDVKKFLKGEKMVWIDVERGTKSEYEFLRKTFDLHPLTIEDMKKSISLPKIDILDRYIFVIFHNLFYDRHLRKIKMNEVDFCVGKNFIITTHDADIASVNEVLRKVTTNIYADMAPDHIMHKIMDLEVDGYMRLMDQLDDEIENLEDKLIRGKANGILRILSDHRREITELRKTVGPQREIVNKLSRGQLPFISSQMIFYFRDVYDHMYRFYSSLEAHRDLVTSAFDTYTSVQSNAINQVVKQLTLISTIFLPLTFIVGIYGMNFRVMPELEYEHGYYIVLLTLALIGVGMFLFFKKKRY